MINLIYSEFLKLKKSSILFLVLIGGLVMPLTLDIAIMIGEQKRTFESYAYNSESISYWMFYGTLFSIIAGYIFTREYTDKTAAVLYSYSFTRNQIFIAKFIVICTLIILVCSIQSIAAYLGYYKLFGVLEKDLVINDIKVNLGAILFQIALVPIPIFFANLKKNIILPVVYGIVNLCSQLVIQNIDTMYTKYDPLLGSLFLFKNLYEENTSLIDIKTTAIVAIICFIISIMACLYQYNKTDMV